MTWLPIRYRDFYDIPRAVVVEWQGGLYLFDCPFDVDADQYPAVYDVVRLPEHVRANIDEISWTDLARRGHLIGSVPTTAVEFDESRRRLMNPAVFRVLEAGRRNPRPEVP